MNTAVLRWLFLLPWHLKCGRVDVRTVDRERVKRGPKFADRKCGRVGKIRTIILPTKNR